MYCHILAKLSDDEFSVPYFYVNNEQDLAEVNMVQSSIQEALLDQAFNIPVLTNGIAVTAGQELRVYSKPLPTVKAAAAAVRVVAPAVPKPKPAVVPSVSSARRHTPFKR